MQQTEMSQQFQEVLYRSERRVQFINYVLAVLLVITLVWAMYAAWRSGQQEKIETINLVAGSVKVLGATSLCPGDAMTIRFSLEIDGTGIIIIDDTVQHGTQTVKFSTAMRDYIPGKSKRTYELTWVVPEHPEMSANGDERWIPGLHIRYITVAASNAYVSRYTEPASFNVPFAIKDDCPG